MALGYPTTSGSYESQQFGPVLPFTPGYTSQPAMYADGRTVAWWNPYKGWPWIAHFHNGLDVAGVEGLALRALEAGVIRYKGWGYIPGTSTPNGGGWVITVEIRPGTRYTFNHCAGFAPGLSVGQRVAKGQIIAYIGSSGAATGPHCHLSLEIDEWDVYTRQLMWDPKLFMVNGPLANDPRVRPLESPTVPKPTAYISTEGDRIMALRYRKDSGTITIRAGKPYRDGPSVSARVLGYFAQDTALRKIGKPQDPTGSYDPWSLCDVYRGNGYGLIWVTGVDAK